MTKQKQPLIGRRAVTMGLAASGLIGPLLKSSPGMAADEFGPQSLIDAANAEGKVVLYTAPLLEDEQIWMKSFNKRFPKIQVELVRAPGGRLFTRIESEAAANKLEADLVDMTDRGLLKRIEKLFIDYEPPNHAKYSKKSQVSPKHWPRSTQGYGLAYNPALVTDPPKSWKDLNNPKWGGKKMGTVIAGSGGTTWTEKMFQRQKFGLDYWKELAKLDPVLYPSNAPTTSSIIRGEVQVATLLVNASFPQAKAGAPIATVFPTEGIPLTPSAAGIFTTAKHPNAAKVLMNWCLSKEGQDAAVEQNGYFSTLEGAARPKGCPADLELWLPDNDEFEKLRDAWIAEWNTIYNYRG
jgi:iron(III) transport system substrate-binding protein